MSDKPRILFLCTGNSCRSQMAEGLLRDACGDEVEVCSAGLQAHGLNPNAVLVMRELGVDISRHRSKTLDQFSEVQFDLVVTVCDHANETCPVFPGPTDKRHRSFDDPPRLAALAASSDEALSHYRRVRDEIAEYVRELARELTRPTAGS